MSTVPLAGRHAGAGAPAYARHRPEQTLLYRLVEEHYPAFVARLAAEGRTLPWHVAREFEDFLACGRLEHGFLRVACDGCRAERLVAFSCKRRGFCPSCGARRMAESAALLVDEVFPARPVRQWVLSVPRQLRLLFAHDSGTMSAVLGVVNRCITSHLATTQSPLRSTSSVPPRSPTASRSAPVAAPRRSRCRRCHRRRTSPSMTHPAPSAGSPCTPARPRARTSARSSSGRAATSAAPPRPRSGCRSPPAAACATGSRPLGATAPPTSCSTRSSRYRARVTPAGRGPGAKRPSAEAAQGSDEGSERRLSSGWARRLERVFGIDVEACADCGGRLRIIACIEDRRLIDSILAHLERRAAASSSTGSTARCRAPPNTPARPPSHRSAPAPSPAPAQRDPHRPYRRRTRRVGRPRARRTAALPRSPCLRSTPHELLRHRRVDRAATVNRLTLRPVPGSLVTPGTRREGSPGVTERTARICYHR